MALPHNTLAIDTTFGACSAALRLPPQDQAQNAQTISRHETMTTGHAERLVGLIADALRDAAIGFDELNAIAATVGPGTFTGTRVGVAAARALALAGDLPIYTATSLAAMAGVAHRTRPVAEPGNANSCTAVCVDARRGQIYYQLFNNPELPAIKPAALASADQIASELPQDAAIVAVGSGAEAVKDAALARSGGVVLVQAPELLPDASALFDIHLEKGTDVRPLYLREPDAKAQTGKSIQRRAR